jgi:hypothetical protein
MIEALNSAYKNNRVYVRLLSQDPGAVIRGETLSSLPPSVLAVLQSEADGGSYTPLNSATLGEWDIPSDHFVTGSRQLIIDVETG